MTYKGRSYADVCLRVLDHAIETDAHESILMSLTRGIKTIHRRIERTPDDGIGHAFIHDDCQIVENMLGVAYVVCQIQIAGVTEAALKFPDQELSPSLIRDFGPRYNERYSKIEVLWALGNYYKHRDSWSADTWTKPGKREKATVAVLRALRLRHDSDGNLRAGAEALGNTSYDDLDVFYQLIRKWSCDVRESIRAKLSEKNT